MERLAFGAGVSESSQIRFLCAGNVAASGLSARARRLEYFLCEGNGRKGCPGFKFIFCLRPPFRKIRAGVPQLKLQLRKKIRRAASVSRFRRKSDMRGAAGFQALLHFFPSRISRFGKVRLYFRKGEFRKARAQVFSEFFTCRKKRGAIFSRPGFALQMCCRFFCSAEFPFERALRLRPKLWRRTLKAPLPRRTTARMSRLRR